jgi:hypothetical protein
MINPQLIDGAQYPRYHSSLIEDGLSPEDQLASLGDADSQLDAFGE